MFPMSLRGLESAFEQGLTIVDDCRNHPIA